MSIIAFKCPCCGAELTFSAAQQKMTCEYCGTEIEMEAAQALSQPGQQTDSMEWTGSQPSTVMIDGDMCVYSCSSCGAEITGDISLGASLCPYCGSPFVVNESFGGMLRPDFVIPFKLDKTKAVETFRSFCKKRPLLPGSFISSHRIESIQGMYVPYWLFDCGAKASYSFRAQRVSHWTEGDYSVTRTSHYLLVREGEMEFDHVPVDGTSKLPKEITEAIEPFECSGAPEFNPAYLAGYLADRYDVSAEESRPRANERIKRSVENEFRRTADTYTSVVVSSSSVSLSDGRISYALMPMWLMTARYKDKLYTFAMNGQTGRFVGELPISRARFWGIFAAVSVISGALVGFIARLLGA